MLEATMAAEGMVSLMMNVPKDCLDKVLAVLPALQKPTVNNLSDENWFDVITITNEKLVRTLIPQLKAAGACGIVELPITKLIN